MKHWGKKLAAMVLCTVLVIGLVPGLMPAAKASFEGYLYVGNEELKENNDIVYGGNGWAKLTLDDTDHNPVLTLHDYSYTGPGKDNMYGMYYYAINNEPLTIELEGTSTITHRATQYKHYSYGLYSNKSSIIISGTGTLNLIAGSNIDNVSFDSIGLYIDAPLSITGGEVHVSGGNLAIASNALRSLAHIRPAGKFSFKRKNFIPILQSPLVL